MSRRPCWPTSLPPACSVWGRSWGRFCGSYRPNFVFDAERLATFLAALPRDTEQAAELARQHDARMENRAWTVAAENRPVRHAMEIRHESFRCRAFVDLLKAPQCPRWCAPIPSNGPRLADVTADFVYCRLHGSEQLYASGYDDAALDDWATRVRVWAAGGVPDDLDRVGPKPAKRQRDVFVYFDNDIKVRAPAPTRAG